MALFREMLWVVEQNGLLMSLVIERLQQGQDSAIFCSENGVSLF